MKQKEGERTRMPSTNPLLLYCIPLYSGLFLSQTHPYARFLMIVPMLPFLPSSPITHLRRSPFIRFGEELSLPMLYARVGGGAAYRHPPIPQFQDDTPCFITTGPMDHNILRREFSYDCFCCYWFPSFSSMVCRPKTR